MEIYYLQCFDTVGWPSVRAPGLQKLSDEVLDCWCGYLSGARCRLFAYADATVMPKPHHLLSQLNPDWFYLSGTGSPRLSLKRGS